MSSQGDKRPEYVGGAGKHAPKVQLAGSVLTRQRRIAHIAQKYADSHMTTLAHHMDASWMHEVFSRVKKKSAPGVDGMSVAEYAKELGENLEGLLERAKSGSYRAPPVKRVLIPNERAGVSSHRHSYRGRQGVATRGCDGAGTDLSSGTHPAPLAQYTIPE